MGVFKRYESVAFRGKVRPGGVQRLLEGEGRRGGLVREGGRWRGSDGNLNTSSQSPGRAITELRRNSSPAPTGSAEEQNTARCGEFNDQELRR